MLNEKYAQIVKSFEEIAKTADDDQITAQSAYIKQLIETDHLPTVALIGLGPTGQSLIQAVGEICETNLPSILNHSFENGPVCLTLEDGTETALYRIEAGRSIQIADAGIRVADQSYVEEMVCEFPCRKLKNARMVLFGGDIAKHEDWLSLLVNVDVVVLRVNATAAMNQAERQWIDDELLPIFGKAHTAIWLDHLNYLNTDEDRKDVMRSIRGRLEKSELEAPIFETPTKVGKWAFAELENMNVRDWFVRKALRVGLHEADMRIGQIMQAGLVDKNGIEKTVAALEQQRGQVELAGKIAADTIVVNTYTNLKVAARESARDYQAQSIYSICQKIADVPYEELETLEPRIQTYLCKIWEIYQQQMNSRLNEETQKCYERIAKQMEQDIGKLISGMDEQTREILQKAIDGVAATQYDTSIPLNWVPQEANGLTRLKSETRNIMLLSIPLVFVSPILAIATLLGAKYYNKIQSGKRGEELKDAMKEQVQTCCSNILEDILIEIDQSFDKAATQTADTVRSAYQKFIDKLIEQLNQLAQQQQAVANRVKALSQIQATMIPQLYSDLTK